MAATYKSIVKRIGLRTCPFCKSGKVTLDPSETCLLFICHGCGANVVFFGEEGDLKGESAIRAWNRRDGEEKNEKE